MNRILFQHTRGTTKQDFIENKYSSWAVGEGYENVWEDSVGDTILLIESGFIYAIVKVIEIEYDDGNPEYPLRYYWHDNIQFVKIPLADFNEIVGYKRNYTPQKYHSIKEDFLEQGFDFLSKYMQNIYSENREDKPVSKKILTNKNDEYHYPRNPILARMALQQANFKCELDENHYTFKSHFSDQNFTEAHHLIPLSFHEKFDFDLDVPANIVSLCPNCHRMIHYGTKNDIKKALETLYKKRAKRLEKTNLDINLDKLQYMYR